jgi:heptosyltransferase-1
VRRPYAGLVRGLAGLRRVWELPEREGRRAVRHALQAVGYDWAIDFQGLGQSALWAWRSGAARRLGFRGRDLREPWARWFYNCFPPKTQGKVHVVERNVHLLRGLGYSAEVLEGELRALSDPALRWSLWKPAPPDVEAGVRPFLPAEPFWVLQPGASRAWKQWSVEAYGNLARRILSRTGRPGLILWGPGDAERARAIAARAGGDLVRPAPPWGWEECALAFRAARVVIGPDTGMTHWADWVGTPVVMWLVPSGWVTVESNGPYFTRARSRVLAVLPGAEPVEAVAEAAIALLGPV